MRSHILSRILLVAATAAPCAGCYTTWDIPVKEVHQLDGYRAPAPRVILDAEGEKVRVDHETALGFESGLPGTEVEAKLDAIDIHAEGGEWLLSGLLHGSGQPFRVDLNQITRITAKRFSPGKTALVSILVPLGLAGLGAGIAIIAVVATIPKD